MDPSFTKQNGFVIPAFQIDPSSENAKPTGRKSETHLKLSHPHYSPHADLHGSLNI